MPGHQGQQGNAGPRGVQGIQGDAGNPGAQGHAGLPGVHGVNAHEPVFVYQVSVYGPHVWAGTDNVLFDTGSRVTGVNPPWMAGPGIPGTSAKSSTS